MHSAQPQAFQERQNDPDKGRARATVRTTELPKNFKERHFLSKEPNRELLRGGISGRNGKLSQIINFEITPFYGA